MCRLQIDMNDLARSSARQPSGQSVPVTPRQAPWPPASGNALRPRLHQFALDLTQTLSTGVLTASGSPLPVGHRTPVRSDRSATRRWRAVSLLVEKIGIEHLQVHRTHREQLSRQATPKTAEPGDTARSDLPNRRRLSFLGAARHQLPSSPAFDDKHVILLGGWDQRHVHLFHAPAVRFARVRRPGALLDLQATPVDIRARSRSADSARLRAR